VESEGDAKKLLPAKSSNKKLIADPTSYQPAATRVSFSASVSLYDVSVFLHELNPCFKASICSQSYATTIVYHNCVCLARKRYNLIMAEARRTKTKESPKKAPRTGPP
jgi:hypothetical protein